MTVGSLGLTGADELAGVDGGGALSLGFCAFQISCRSLKPQAMSRGLRAVAILPRFWAVERGQHATRNLEGADPAEKAAPTPDAVALTN
jgi:hypothetical protein